MAQVYHTRQRAASRNLIDVLDSPVARSTLLHQPGHNDAPRSPAVKPKIAAHHLNSNS
ncbi:MAG: hypothetical protein OJF49_004091 [Ktedonobacterales bacterium]|nr:MAG: hypothetical protein OJF49_004091 [Ktedonobacterales bacterium]